MKHLKSLTHFAIATLVGFGTAVVLPVVDADTTWNGPNGYKIYVSPAKHSPDNVGCDNHKESQWAQNLGWTAAAGAGYDLVARGYSVRLGTGVYWENKNSSNSWGADYHIPMHSNAPGSTSSWDCTAPYNLSTGASGTLLMHYPGSTGGSGLSNSLVTTIAGMSPGSGQDRAISSTCCTEITSTNAAAAYLESAFHTFNPDQDWLTTESNWGWRVGYGVDLYLGYP